MHRDRRDGVLRRELRERRAAVALDTLEDPRPPEHRRERDVDHRRATADSVPASNRWMRSRSTAARTCSPISQRRRRRRLDDDPLIADLDVDERAVAQRLDRVDPAVERRRLVARLQRQVLGAHAEQRRAIALEHEPGIRQRPSGPLEPPVGRARQQVHARRADERGDPAVRRAVVDLRRRADLLDGPVPQHGEPVGHRHRLDLVVGHVQERPSQRPVDAGELGAHLHAQLEVQVRQRLVHQERARVAHQRPPEGDALHLAARQLRRLALHQLLDVQQLGHAGDLRVDLGLRQLARPQRRGDVGRRRLLRIQRVRLEDHRQVALGGRRARRVEARQVHRAGVRLLEPRDHPQRRGLARARRAEQHEERPVGNVEVRGRRAPGRRRTPSRCRWRRWRRSSAGQPLGLRVVHRRRRARVADGHDLLVRRSGRSGASAR